MPPRAGDVTMDSTKLTQALGYPPFDPWPLHDDHVPTHRDWHHERGAEKSWISRRLLAEVLYRNPGMLWDGRLVRRFRQPKVTDGSRASILR